MRADHLRMVIQAAFRQFSSCLGPGGNTGEEVLCWQEEASREQQRNRACSQGEQIQYVLENMREGERATKRGSLRKRVLGCWVLTSL